MFRKLQLALLVSTLLVALQAGTISSMAIENPVEAAESTLPQKRSADFFDILLDYWESEELEDYEESEHYLVCRNCTVVVQAANAYAATPPKTTAAGAEATNSKVDSANESQVPNGADDPGKRINTKDGMNEQNANEAEANKVQDDESAVMEEPNENEPKVEENEMGEVVEPIDGDE